jgi:glycosyltransferase involved in cell wall biosynthesis
MGVNYETAQQIGFFDEKNFGKGYGEENDWCQRAIKAGYRNLLVPNLFVYHKHGGSFDSEEKKRLIANNALKLLKKHPDYYKDVQTYIAKDPHRVLRNMLIVIAASKKEEGMHLVIDHALGGGANHYAMEYLSSLRDQEKSLLYLTYDFYIGKYMLHFTDPDYDLKFSIDAFDGLKVFLSQLHLSEIFLNSLVSFKHIEETIALIKELQEAHHARLIIPIHDYYPVCPSYTLLNEEGRYCGVPDIKTCQSCMEKNQQEWRNFYGAEVNMPLWRDGWYALLQQSTEILCFSGASREILMRAYPELPAEKITLIPHQVTDIEPVQLPEADTDTLTVGILGAINYAKGAQLIKELVDEIESRKLNIRVVVIGEITEPIRSEHFAFTGKYDRQDLPRLIGEHHIDLFLIPSIWPETFSYTAEEIMQMQLPLMVFDLGAPAERVKHYEKGFIIPDISAEGVLKTVTKFRSRQEA